MNLSVTQKKNSLAPQYGPGLSNGQDAGHSCPKLRCHLPEDPRCCSSVLPKPNVTLEAYIGLLTWAPSGHKIEQYQIFLSKCAPYDQEKKVHQSLEQIFQ